MADPAVGEDDIGVEDLAGEGVGARGSDGGAHAIGEPADEIVIHVFRVFFHVFAGGGVLEVDLDGIDETDLFERLVPHFDAFLDPAAVADGGGVFDVEDDGGFGRTEFQGGVGLFEVPAVDEAGLGFLRGELAEVRVGGREVAHAFVRETGLVACVVRDEAEAVVERAEFSARGRGFHGDFHIIGECLGGLDLVESLVHAERFCAEEFFRVHDHEFVEVDDGAAIGHDRLDGHVEDDAVREEPLDAVLARFVSRRADAQFRSDHGDAFSVGTPVEIEVACLQSGVVVTAGDREGEVVFLTAEILREFRVELLVLGPAPECVERLPAVGRAHHLFKSLEDILDFREVRLSGRVGHGHRGCWNRRRSISLRSRRGLEGILGGKRSRQAGEGEGESELARGHGFGFYGFYGNYQSS